MDQYLADVLKDTGPRKQLSGPPAPSTTTHKIRSAWFQAREAWPLREAPVDRLVQERARVAVEMSAADGEVPWSPIGPANIGGRATCIVCHPVDPARIWLGSAGGGVWHSQNAGQTWAP